MVQRRDIVQVSEGIASRGRRWPHKACLALGASHCALDLEPGAGGGHRAVDRSLVERLLDMLDCVDLSVGHRGLKRRMRRNPLSHLATAEP